MHTAPIKQIDTDADGRHAVTSSHDKTARVWDVATGKQLRVLRPPLADGNEGKLNAVAISPDGSAVAAAGWTKLGSDQGHTVYAFDRASGQMLKRLTGLPNVILHLSFSPDGRWLAVTLGGALGLRVWDWQAGTAPLSDPDFKDQSYGASWGRDGRLVVSSFDGKLRLYQMRQDAQGAASLHKLAQAQAPGGQQPSTLAFHPDGSRVAVGYNDSQRVDVLDAGTLALAYPADVQGVNKGELAAVVWSRDGRYLAAAGQWQVNSRHPMRLWADQGRGPATDLPTASNTVMHLSALPDGAWLLAAADPAWGVVSADGAWQAKGLSPIADLRGSLGGAFLLAQGGHQLQFGFEYTGQPPHHFDLRRRVLQAGPLAKGSPPEIKALPVVDWEDKLAPALRGQPLALQANELARSLAITPGATGFVLGSDYRLRYFNAAGQPQWPPQPVPGTVWGLNIPTDGPQAGKLVVAAYGDGSIRWHRLSDGQELLAFLPHADRKRWVLWTPSGYYDASPGGEDLIGWHVNRGRDQAADFYSASQLRERFYRPDVIDRVLDTLDEGQALDQANQAAGRLEGRVAVAKVLPPVVDAVSVPLRFGDLSVQVRIHVRTPPGAPRTGLRVQVNGQFMALPPGPRAMTTQGHEELTLTLPPKDSTVKIYAENRNGLSLPLSFDLKWAPGQLLDPGQQAGVAKPMPRLWVLAVGVSSFKHKGVRELGFAQHDALAFDALMLAQKGKLYRDVQTRVLTDPQADRASVLDGLAWLQAQVQPGDTGMLFLAGHGYTVGSDHRYFYAAHDVDPQRLPETGVPHSAINQALVAISNKGDGSRAMFFVDTCHAGDAAGARVVGNLKASNANDLATQLSSDINQVLVFASSSGDQLSWEAPELGHGLFTQALIDALGDKWEADAANTGTVTHKLLDYFVPKRVAAYALRFKNPPQTPRLMQPPGGIDDLTLAIR